MSSSNFQRKIEKFVEREGMRVIYLKKMGEKEETILRDKEGYVLVSGTGGEITNIVELKGRTKENFKELLMCLHSRTSHYPLEKF